MTAVLLALVLAQQPAPPLDPAELKKLAEPLPDAPRIEKNSELTPLNKAKTLLLEKTATRKRVLVASEVCLQQGTLEVLLCRKNTKEHEAIVRTDLDARFIHAALIAAGAKPGSTVQFVDPKTGEPAYKPATGAKIDVRVCYRKGGKVHDHPAQEWIRDTKTKKPMAHGWVFAGSRFLKNPDAPNDPDYYCANNGEVIAISNFADSMLDLPVAVSQDLADLHFEVMPNAVPPLLSGVWVTLEAAK